MKTEDKCKFLKELVEYFKGACCCCISAYKDRDMIDPECWGCSGAEELQCFLDEEEAKLRKMERERNGNSLSN